MEFSDVSNYYELLDVSPDASQQEIRAAYMRAKACFQKDSLATYSLMDPTEAQEMIRKIDFAYHVLSHPEKKRTYDRDFLAGSGDIKTESQRSEGFNSSYQNKVISIDRVPPMDSGSEEGLLIPPSTDYGAPTRRTRSEPPPSPFGRIESDPFSFPSEKEDFSTFHKDSEHSAAPAVAKPLEPDVETVQEWTGEEIRKVRLARECAIEHLVEVTRIRKSYILAIEDEDFSKLPAPVFVRGFILQIGRELKIPTDRLVRTYLARLDKWTVSISRKPR
jgi:hypothetical protein